MRFDELKFRLEVDLQKQLVPPRLLLDRCRLLDESSRQTPAYSDPKYVPFYYHLGKYIQPKTLLELGFKLGLFSNAFLYSCKSVESVFGFQPKVKEYYTPRLGIKNIRDVYKGELKVYVGRLIDDDFSASLKSKTWDVVFMNEELGYDEAMMWLETVWPHMPLEGMIVMNYIDSHEPSKRTFADFCKVKNREGATFRTRYGTGIINK